MARASPAARRRARLSVEQLALFALAALLMVAASLRREFLGDGVRHLPAILSDHLQFGEPRWLLFPVVARLWIHGLSGVGLLSGTESVLRALLVLSVVSGILFLVGIRVWLCREYEDAHRRALALLLAGSCAPVLILFSDIAEPPLAAALVVAGLAYARTQRDDPDRATSAAFCAIAAIAVASLIYQGTILAFGMLPLVVSTRTTKLRHLVIATLCAVLAVAITMTVIQVSTGTPTASAVASIVGGEQNPLTRSLMESRSSGKYAVAAVAGPPQGIVALDSYGGLRALLAALHSDDDRTVALSVRNLTFLVIGLLVTTVLLVRGIRDRQWSVLIAAAILLALPVVRNQQYAYVKFYVLWPIPVALLAGRCSVRTSAAVASAVLAANVWVMGDGLLRGREHYRLARQAYATATPATCWLTSGWTPPFPYLWPGRATPILGILATGSRPETQGPALTTSLKRCFCESDAVWTDTTTRDAEVVRTLASHFAYDSTAFSRVLIDAAEAARNPLPGVVVYESSARQRACQAFQP